MNDFKPDIQTIERWAYTTELDQEFNHHQDEDYDLFELAISRASTLQDDYRFAADARCLKREFFANRLATELTWIYAFPMPLPFHFSRLQGLKKRETYLAEVVNFSSNLYERALVIELMQYSQDPALQAFAKVLLDQRWKYGDSTREECIQLRRTLSEEVLPLFAAGAG